MTLSKLLYLLTSLAFVFFAVFSYSFTDPNLVLSSNEIYWNFQQFMWRTFFDNPPLQTKVYALLIFFLAIGYLYLITYAKLSQKKKMVLLAIISSILFLSYNALSHDIFNYIFNAKMVVVYNVNPHLKAATDIVYDDWTRFMHNVHTPAPYGYGWTVVSLLPYMLGFNTFLLTFLWFKLFALLSFVATAIFLIKQKGNFAWIFLFNPLVLIEVISTGHNDLFMMLPAVIALTILVTKPSWKKILLAVVLLAISISIKLATVALIPLAFILIIRTFALGNKWLKPLELDTYWSVYASLLMFLPLLTTRSQQFLPWYLIWSLIWMPFFPAKSSSAKIWQITLIIFSISALYRYLPWIYNGNYSILTLSQQVLITWVPAIVYCCFSLGYYVWQHYLKTDS